MINRVVWAGNFLLLSVLVWVSLQLFNGQRQAAQKVDKDTLSGLLSLNTPTAEENLRTITNAGLFGPEGGSVEIAGPVETASPTPLKLILHGVVLAENPRDGHAIISTENGSHRSYVLGDVLPGNAKLSQILVDRVIFERAGKREFLRLQARGTERR